MNIPELVDNRPPRIPTQEELALLPPKVFVGLLARRLRRLEASFRETAVGSYAAALDRALTLMEDHSRGRRIMSYGSRYRTGIGEVFYIAHGLKGNSDISQDQVSAAPLWERAKLLSLAAGGPPDFQIGPSLWFAVGLQCFETEDEGKIIADYRKAAAYSARPRHEGSEDC